MYYIILRIFVGDFSEESPQVNEGQRLIKRMIRETRLNGEDEEYERAQSPYVWQRRA
jgi:hypothetical protein